MNSLSRAEADMQKRLSDAWRLLERMLRPAHVRWCPSWVLPLFFSFWVMTWFVDTLCGVPAVSSAAGALLSNSELTFVAPFALSGVASFIMIAVGLGADLCRREFAGATRAALTIAAMTPIAIVTMLVAFYIGDLLTLTEGDAVDAPTGLKLIVPALAAVCGHAVLLALGRYLGDALQVNERKRLRRRLNIVFEDGLRPAALTFIATYEEQERAIARLKSFGEPIGVESITMPGQALSYHKVAEEILKPGDPIQILLAVRSTLHPVPSSDAKTSTIPEVVSMSAPLQDHHDSANGTPRPNAGTTSPAVAAVLSTLLVLVAPDLADANRLPSRTGRQGYQLTAGTATQSIGSSRPHSSTARPPVPPGQQSPTLHQMAEQRKLLPMSPKGYFTANLAKTSALSRSGHRHAGNRQLARTMEGNDVVRRRLETAFGHDTHERLRRGRNPRGAEWDHSQYAKNHLQLLKKSDHAQITRKQGRGGGGMKRFWSEGRVEKAPRRGPKW